MYNRLSLLIIIVICLVNPFLPIIAQEIHYLGLFLRIKTVTLERQLTIINEHSLLDFMTLDYMPKFSVQSFFLKNNICTAKPSNFREENG